MSANRRKGEKAARANRLKMPRRIKLKDADKPPPPSSVKLPPGKFADIPGQLTLEDMGVILPE